MEFIKNYLQTLNTEELHRLEIQQANAIMEGDTPTAQKLQYQINNIIKDLNVTL